MRQGMLGALTARDGYCLDDEQVEGQMKWPITFRWNYVCPFMVSGTMCIEQ